MVSLDTGFVLYECVLISAYTCLSSRSLVNLKGTSSDVLGIL